MPFAPPGWTLIQRVDLRVGAIEYLKMMSRRTCPSTFFTVWWDFWMQYHGVPDPKDSSVNYELYVTEYRRRVFRTMRWYACRGRHAPSNSVARMARMRLIRRELLADVDDHRDQGLNFNQRLISQGRSHLFEDTIQGFSIMELRSQSD